MRRGALGGLVAACLLMAGLMVIGPPPAVAATVTLAAPQIGGGEVRLTGTVARPQGRVALQQRSGGAWLTVARRRAGARGGFTFVRIIPRTDTWFRVASGRQVSRQRLVRGHDRCGVRPRRPDGSLWDCSFVDGFGGTTLDRAKWTPLVQPGKGTVKACNLDDPRTVDVRDGQLRLTVRRSGNGLVCPLESTLQRTAQFASASVSTYRSFDQRYGRFEARIRPHPTSYPGVQEAFWLWPAWDLDHVLDLWPAAGEIDIAESYSHLSHLAIPFLHYGEDDNGGPVPGLNTAWHCAASRGEFNTYTLSWTAEQLTVVVNGQRCLVNTKGAASFRKRFFVNLTQLIGLEANAYDGRAPLPATMQVDYVKVWR